MSIYPFYIPFSLKCRTVFGCNYRKFIIGSISARSDLFDIFHNVGNIKHKGNITSSKMFYSTLSFKKVGRNKANLKASLAAILVWTHPNITPMDCAKSILISCLRLIFVSKCFENLKTQRSFDTWYKAYSNEKSFYEMHP